MTQPAWLARTVLYRIDAARFAEANGGAALERIAADLDYLADLGVNALGLGGCFGADSGAGAARIDARHGDDASFDALLDAARARGIRVCIAPPPHAAAAGPGADRRVAWQRVMAAWFDRGVDGVIVEGAADRSDPHAGAPHRLWRDLDGWRAAAYGDRALLFALGLPRAACEAGFDVADAAYGDRAPAADPGALASVRDIGRAEQPRDGDDLKVLFTFLLTWPHVPCIRYGDEIGATDAPSVAALRARRAPLWHHVERLIYLRVTEADLAGDATSALLGAAPGRPLLYRRGATLIVALNPGLATHVVALPPVGDAAPVLEHHCHASHGANGWQLKIGARGYGIFTVR